MEFDSIPKFVLFKICNLKSEDTSVKKIFTLIMLLSGLFYIASVVSCSKGDDKKVDKKPKFTDMVKIGKITTAKKMGQVTMSHKKHIAVKVKCFDCHHKKENKKNVKDCTSCHLDKKGDDKIIHRLCVECHKKQKKGPVKCLECHKKK